MAPVAQRRFVDDDDPYYANGDGPYDPAYPGRKVVADGGKVRVRAFLMDGSSDPRFVLHDAAHLHRPHQVRVVDSERRKVEAAYDQRSREMQEMWRSPGNPAPPIFTDPEEARADMIRRQGEAWKSPTGRPDFSVANAVQAGFIASEKLGATPGAEGEAIDEARRSRGSALPAGVRFPGPAKRSAGQAEDAADDRDAAYREYLNRLENGWRT